jgi:hypothetical protein
MTKIGKATEEAKNTNTNTPGVSEIRELTDGELDAVNGGKGNASFFNHCTSGSHFKDVKLEV